MGSSLAPDIATTMTDVDFDLEQWPFYWITGTSAKYIQALEDELAGGDLDIPSWRVLMLLGGDDARSISYLAKEAVSKLPTMTRIIYRMKDQGLVDVRPRKSDNRVTEVLLTKKGRYNRRVAWMHAQNVVQRALATITGEELQTVIHILRKISANLADE